ncbi:MAG: DUF4252 domain-containing protein [Bacteroidota bacterium]
MKRTLFFGLFALLTLHLSAQNAIDTYFKAHLENPAFDKFEVTERSFDLVAEVETYDAEEQRVLDAIAELDGIKVISNEETPIGSEYFADAAAKFDADEAYQDLVTVEHDDAQVRLLIREDETAIYELVAVVAGDDEFVVASLYGTIDVASLSRMMTVLRNGNMDWMKNFEQLHGEAINVESKDESTSPNLSIDNVDFNNLKLSIYPNPTTDFINIAAQNGNAADLKIGFFSIAGKEIQNVGKVQLPYKVNLSDLPTGTYFLRLTDSSGKFKNFKVVKNQ